MNANSLSLRKLMVLCFFYTAGNALMVIGCARGIFDSSSGVLGGLAILPAIIGVAALLIWFSERPRPWSIGTMSAMLLFLAAVSAVNGYLQELAARNV
jgi:hypothetical protein